MCRTQSDEKKDMLIIFNLSHSNVSFVPKEVK